MSAPFEMSDRTRFLGFEFDDGHQEYFSYLNLREFRHELVDPKEGIERLELFFDPGLGVIQGKNLKRLIPALLQEQVTLLRKGIHEDPEMPEISKVRFVRDYPSK